MRPAHSLISRVAVVLAVLGWLTVSAAPALAASASPGWTIESLAQPTDFISADAVQQVAVGATSGTFTLTFSKQTTVPIAYDATAATVQSDLDALSSIGGVGGSVTVTGGPPGSEPYVVTFGGSLAGKNVDDSMTGEPMTVGVSSLGTAVGSTLSCAGGPLNPPAPNPTSIGYQWLRNDVPIAGATSATYTTVAADGGTAVQCQVFAITPNNNDVGSTQVSAATVISPPPGTALPTPPASIGAPSASGKSLAVESTPVGVTLTCSPESGQWSGGPTFGYQWYRNGVALSGNGADTSVYTVQSADLANAAAFQCAVTGTNAGGASAVVSAVTETSPSAHAQLATASAGVALVTQTTVGDPGNPEAGETGGNHYVLVIMNAGSVASSGPVTIKDTLPAGLAATSIKPENIDATSNGSETGFSCQLATLTCTYSNPVAPMGMLTVTIGVRVVAGGPVSVTNSATVSGDEAPVVSTDAAPNQVSSPAASLFGLSGFGPTGFEFDIAGVDGAPDTQAGGHPYALTVNIGLNTNNPRPKLGTPQNGSGVNEHKPPTFEPVESPKNVVVELPLGFVGDPEALPSCPQDLLAIPRIELIGGVIPGCPAGSVMGYVTLEMGLGTFEGSPDSSSQISLIYNATPEKGYPLEFEFSYAGQAAYLYPSVIHTSAGYVLRVSDVGVPRAVTLNAISLTFFGNPTLQDGTANPGATFFNNPTACTGEPLQATIHVDSWQNPAPVPLNANGSEDLNAANFNDPQWQTATATIPPVTGCSQLEFGPSFAMAPSPASEGGTTQADEPSGYTAHLRLSQTQEPSKLATAELKTAKVTLPEGVSVSPAGAGGLQACSDQEIDLNSADPGSCPLASRVGSVKVTTPILAKALEGGVFLGEPECSPCSAAQAAEGKVYRLFIEVNSEEYGLVVKLLGDVRANPLTGQLTAEFKENPQLPFSELELKFKDGPRAPLANPQVCGTYTTSSVLEPWSAPFTPSVTSESPFSIDWDGKGGACPASMPFDPGFTAGTASSAAGAYSSLTVEISREDREQDLSGVTVHTPPGVVGNLSGVPLCAEAQANAGTCGAESLIGGTSGAVGPGPDPFWITDGRVYLTGPYKGGSFGLSIVVPAVAGPFNLGTVVVRAKIEVNQATAALTVTSDPLPQIWGGVPLRLRDVVVNVDRPGFMLNATSCAPQAITATLTGEHPIGVNAEAPKTSQVSSSYQAQGCADLKFEPKLAVSTQGKTSKANGASLTIKLTKADVPQGSQADVAKFKVDLPKQLPSRLTTLQKACTAAQFEANEEMCPAASVVGHMKVSTPILPVALEGPMYFVSHGGEAFPSLEIVLKGYGVKVILTGSTFISKAGVTSSTFNAIPDAPFSSVEVTLPEGRYSALAGNGNLCTSKLAMPTALVAQNGAEIHESTKIAVTGCAKAKTLTRAQKLKAALKACKKKAKGKQRQRCERKTRKRYGPLKKAKKKGKAKK